MKRRNYSLYAFWPCIDGPTTLVTETEDIPGNPYLQVSENGNDDRR